MTDTLTRAIAALDPAGYRPPPGAVRELIRGLLDGDARMQARAAAYMEAHGETLDILQTLQDAD